ncbi:MAG: sigma-70 family RNA polymerase sigma factor [Acidimicrobiales bacterium]
MASPLQQTDLTQTFTETAGSRPVEIGGRETEEGETVSVIDAGSGSESSAAQPDRRLGAASEKELANALCAGEIMAFDEAFRRHAARVANTVRGIAGAHYVDDVVQEVFLSLWRAPEHFRPERGSLATYLVILTRGKTRDAVRSDGAWQRRHRQHEVQSRSGDEPEDLIMARVSAAELRMALRVLPMTERVAIELAFFGGDSYRQVAAKLGEPEGTIKSRIRSGLGRLEAALRGIRAAEFD